MGVLILGMDIVLQNSNVVLGCFAFHPDYGEAGSRAALCF